MRNPFKGNKNHLTKEQRQEGKRREDLIRGLHELLLGCENAQDMRTRVEVIHDQINHEGERLLQEYKSSLAKQSLASLNLKATDGKGKEIEEKLLQFFADERIEVAQTLMQNWFMIHEAYCRKDLLERKPETLKIHFKD